MVICPVWEQITNIGMLVPNGMVTQIEWNYAFHSFTDRTQVKKTTNEVDGDRNDFVIELIYLYDRIWWQSFFFDIQVYFFVTHIDLFSYKKRA